MNEYGITAVVLSVVSGVVFLYGGWTYMYMVATHKEQKIVTVHLCAGIFHVMSALALGWLAESEAVMWDAPTYTLVSIWQNTTAGSCSTDGRCFIGTKLERGRNVPVAIFAVLFGIISGYAHILAAVYVGPRKLTEYAESGTNWTRWADYTCSASLMIIVVACLSGVLDSYVLLVIAVLQAVLLSWAYFIEKDLAAAYLNNAEELRTRGLAGLGVACVFYVPGVWAPVIGSFYQSIGSAVSTDVPEWVNAMIWILFLLFSSFVGVMVYYLVWTGDSRRVSDAMKTRNMVLQELGYICLSLTSKITLHWVLFMGITSRSGVLFATETEATDLATYHKTGEDKNATTSKVLVAAAASITFGLMMYIVFRVYILKEYVVNVPIKYKIVH